MPTVRAGKLPASLRVPENAEWSLSSGWHYKRPVDWLKNLEDKKQVHHRQALDFQGNPVDIQHVSGKYDDYIGFHAQQGPTETYNERIAYSDAAFDSDKLNGGSDIITVPQDPDKKLEGHIAKLEYAAKEKVMRVTFANGSVTSYFNFEHGIAGLLLRLAITGQTAGYYYHGRMSHVRHALGVEFWQLVRIRNQRTGSRYPFEYNKIESKYRVGFGNKHYLKISRALLDKIATSRQKGILENIQMFNPRKKDEVLMNVAMTDEEYAAFVDFVSHFENDGKTSLDDWVMQAGKAIYDKDKAALEDVTGSRTERAIDTREFFEDRVIAQLDVERGTATADEIALVSRYEKPGVKQEANLAQDILDDSADWAKKVQARVDAFKTSDEVAEVYTKMVNSGRIKPSNDTDAIDVQEDELMPVYRMAAKRGGDKEAYSMLNPSTGKIREPYLKPDEYSMASFFKTGKAALGSEGLRSWKHEKLPALYALTNAGNYWTPKRLTAIGKIIGAYSNLDGRIINEYNAYIRNKDWESALNFLKSHGRNTYYTDDKGIKKALGYRTFAQPNDFVRIPKEDR